MDCVVSSTAHIADVLCRIWSVSASPACTTFARSFSITRLAWPMKNIYIYISIYLSIYLYTCADNAGYAVLVSLAILGSVRLRDHGHRKTYFTKSNVTVARAMVKRLYTDLKSTTAITQEIDAFVAGTEYATLPMTLFTDYANTPALLAHIRSIVCPPEVIELCAIEIPDEARRRVLDEGSISVEITYTINSELFESLAVNGTSFSDGSAFEEALAALLGVNSSEISLSAVSGKLVIEYVVTEEAAGDDPLSEANLAALQAVRDELAVITAALVSELGLDPVDVSTSDIDFCSGRDCNGRGTCNADTGVCFCTDTDYWGINCETVVNCNGGTKVPNEAYCACEYPDYGLRCASTVDCLCA